VVGGAPWPNVAEIEAVLPHDKWTLVGGLMAQLHGIHADIDTLRPTNDVDIVLHVETTRGIASETAEPLNRSAMSWRRRSMSGTTPPTGSSGPRYRTPPHSGERCRPTSAPTARPRCGSSTPDAWDVNRGWSDAGAAAVGWRFRRPNERWPQGGPGPSVDSARHRRRGARRPLRRAGQ